MAVPSSATLQQYSAPQTSSRIVITTKDMDPSCSFVKEVNVGNTVICYVPHNVVFSEPSNFFSINSNNVVHVKCIQTDINFSMALLCKPQQLPENCLAVWTVNDRVRRHAMWSSPEDVYSKSEEPQMSSKSPCFIGKCTSREKLKRQLVQRSVRGPVSFSGHSFEMSRAGSKKYQGRVPSIVALLTNHARSHHRLSQKNVKNVDSHAPMPKIFQANYSRAEKAFWQQKRFAPVSQEIHKAWNKHTEHSRTDATPFLKEPGNEDESKISPIKQKIESINKGKKFGFSYHLDPPTSTCQVSRPSVLNLPPPPQMPLPPVPEIYDPAVPGPSSWSGDYSYRKSTPWEDLPQAAGIFQAVDARKAQRLSESVTFANPYTKRADSDSLYTEQSRSTEAILTPYSERQRRDSTCLFIPQEAVKPYDINRQKLSAVLVLTGFVLALLVFYLVYFL